MNTTNRFHAGTVLHRAENIERAQRCSSWHHRKWSSAMFRCDVVSLETLFAICTCFSLTANSTLKKTRSTCHVLQCKHSKRRKAKEKEVTFSKKRLIMMYHHNMLVHLCHLKVWSKPAMSFVLGDKVLLFLWLASIWLQSRLGSKTWWPMALLCHNSNECEGWLDIFSSVISA